MAATKREVDAQEAERLQRIRITAEVRERARQAECPDPRQDPLGALADYCGAKNGRGATVGPRWDERYRQIINAAREARMSWREIAVAMGLDPTPQVEQQIADAQRSRNKGYERWVEEQGELVNDDYYSTRPIPPAASNGD